MYTFYWVFLRKEGREFVFQPDPINDQFLTEESKRKQSQADLIRGNIKIQKPLKGSTA